MGDFLAMPIKAKPYFHQQMAFDFACNKFGITTPNITSNGVALLMEMGCGKSLTGIGIAGVLFQFGRIRRALIVCPFLAAQNPTIQNMKVDIGNITARAAFTCAKRNFSEVILGEGGAENLSGRGDMYFKAPQYDGLQRIQGNFISPQELQQVLYAIKVKWERKQFVSESKFIIREEDLQRTEWIDNSIVKSTIKSKENGEQLFAKVAVWALVQRKLSF